MVVDLSQLDPDQRQAALAPRGPVCILAGAGTGKTRTITYRIARMISEGFTSQNRVLAVTFTSRAAEEMRARLAGMGVPKVQARTFHSSAMRQLGYFWPQVAGDMKWELLSDKFRFVAQAARSTGYDTQTESIRDLLVEIEWAKSSMVGPAQYEEKAEKFHRDIPAPAEKIAQAYRAYENLKNTGENIFFDFDDVLIQTIAAFEHAPGVAEEFREQYKTFVVDEYQDVTPLQQRLLECWLGERDDITVVGDANQTIYSFTGASPQYLLDFTRKYENATLIRLQKDYRSTPQITELANTVISHATGRFAGSRLDLEGMQPNGPAPVFLSCDDEPTEAQAVVERIKKLLDQGIKASEIAILFRINSQSVAFETALSDAGIAYQIRGGEGFFHRNDIRRAITQLVSLAQREDINAVRGKKILDFIRAALVTVGLSAKIPDGAVARERWHNLNALVGLIEEILAADPNLNLLHILMELKRREEAKCPPTVESITLASLHASKGLEWDAVFLVGLTEGSIPIRHAIDAGPAAIEEERRLFYVGITRAKTYLCCSWSFARQEGNRQNRKRTRFLDGIVVEEKGKEKSGKKKKPRGSARVCSVCGKVLKSPTSKVLGRCESCPGDYNFEVVNALRQWRLNKSRELHIPAFQILSDAKLLAIAEAMPANHAELMNLPGIGPHIIRTYGDELFAILHKFRW